MDQKKVMTALVPISTRSASISWEKKQWLIKEESITVAGYHEDLGEGIAIKMIQICAGEFHMGSPANERGRNNNEHNKRLTRIPTYFLGQTPVTQAQWKIVAGWQKFEKELDPDPSGFKGDNRPVEQVSWEEAIEFCNRISQRSQREYTLPSEAQWEYACRAGTTSPFAFGETLNSELANYNAVHSYNSGMKGICRYETTDVGQFPSNAWGLNDMHGNVWEWCLDRWHQDDEYIMLMRGGSWISMPKVCRSAYRDAGLRFKNCKSIGFRICCKP
jgi:formylglycine-generating enzyme required for sulfatase activity